MTEPAAPSRGDPRARRSIVGLAAEMFHAVFAAIRAEPDAASAG